MLAATNGGWGGMLHRFQLDDSIHVLQAQPGDPRVSVIAKPSYYTGDCASLPATVPLPYQANRTSAGLEATCLVVWNLTKQYGEKLRGEQCTSVDAAGLPVSALMVSADEVKSGSVNHALRFILPNANMQRQVYVRPATHAGAPTNPNAHAPPYGVRFRLKTSRPCPVKGLGSSPARSKGTA